MSDLGWNPLHGAPSYPAERYAVLADRIGGILRSRNDILLVQAEAVVALEAAAVSLARPGLTALNIITSSYGGWFGQWLRRGGAAVATGHRRYQAHYQARNPSRSKVPPRIAWEGTANQFSKTVA